MTEKIIGKFQKHAHFGFIIPKNRDIYGGDFFVTEKNSKNAQDGDTVTGHILSKNKGKKPEAKIIQIGEPVKIKPKNIIGIYSEHKGDFGFVDVELETKEGNTKKGYFVFKRDNLGAKDGDKVEAIVKVFKGKEEATVLKILKNDNPSIIGEFKDNGKFGFVTPENNSFPSDIFVAGAKKLEAKTGDKVSVQIIKSTGRRPEGIIRKIIKKV